MGKKSFCLRQIVEIIGSEFCMLCDGIQGPRNEFELTGAKTGGY